MALRDARSLGCWQNKLFSLTLGPCGGGGREEMCLPVCISALFPGNGSVDPKVQPLTSAGLYTRSVTFMGLHCSRWFAQMKCIRILSQKFAVEVTDISFVVFMLYAGCCCCCVWCSGG